MAPESDTDPDWFLDHVLYYAEPGSAAPIRVDEAVRWSAWWRSQARVVQAEWPHLASVALEHGFTLTAGRLGELGVSRARARGLIRGGRWAVPARGAVTLIGPTALSADDPNRWMLDQRRHALACSALAATNSRHVVTGRSATVLHGLPVHALPGRPELTASLESPTHGRGARVARLPAADVTDWYGTPVTTVARSVLDVARAGRRDGIVAADAALRNEQVTRSQLEVALAGAAGWPGTRQAREIVALADPHAESPPESILRLAVHDAGLPAPRLQARLPVPDGRGHYRVDMLWDAQRLIVEADGRVKYGSSGGDHDPLWAERKRQTALARLGYRVERVVWSDVVTTWPATYALLAEALGYEQSPFWYAAARCRPGFSPRRRRRCGAPVESDLDRAGLESRAPTRRLACRGPRGLASACSPSSRGEVCASASGSGSGALRAWLNW